MKTLDRFQQNRMVDTVKTAVDRCSKGADPSKVVAELAIEKDMTTEQAARICEAVNKIASINYLSDKNNDREADFPLANSSAVVKMMKDTYKIAKEPFKFRKTASEGLGNTKSTLDKMNYVTDEERKRYEDSYAQAKYSAGWMDVQRATQSLKIAADEERLATYKLHEDLLALANKCASLSDEDAQDMANYTVYTYGKDGLNFLTALENLTDRPYDKSYRPFMKTGSDVENAIDQFMFNADQLMGLRDTLGVFKEASDSFAVKEAGKGGRGKKNKGGNNSSSFTTTMIKTDPVRIADKWNQNHPNSGLNVDWTNVANQRGYYSARTDAANDQLIQAMGNNLASNENDLPSADDVADYMRRNNTNIFNNKQNNLTEAEDIEKIRAARLKDINTVSAGSRYDIDQKATDEEYRQKEIDTAKKTKIREWLQNNPGKSLTPEEIAEEIAAQERFNKEKSEATRDDWKAERKAKQDAADHRKFREYTEDGFLSEQEMEDMREDIAQHNLQKQHDQIVRDQEQESIDQQKRDARQEIYRSHFGDRMQSADLEKARMDAEEEIWKHRDIAKQRRDRAWADFGKSNTAANKWLDDIKTDAINNVKSSYNMATGLFKYLDAARKGLQGPQLSGNEYSSPLSLKASKYLDNLGLHDTFAKAYLSDPYLRQYSPKEVAEAFNIVHEVAPDIITKNASPHVVSAMIRKYLASNNQIDPIEVRDLVSTEKDRAQTDLTRQQLENLKRTKPNK